MLVAIIIVFVLGYIAIAFEHPLKVNKTASALVTGIVCWTLFALAMDSSLIHGPDSIISHEVMERIELDINENPSATMDDHTIWQYFIEHELGHHLSEIAQILFFLMGAMTIVELVDIHGGFRVITDKIKTTNRVKLMWVICFLTFFLSAALDNLTTAIVMVSLLSKLIKSKEDRMMFAGMIVIAANAGGA